MIWEKRLVLHEESVAVTDASDRLGKHSDELTVDCRSEKKLAAVDDYNELKMAKAEKEYPHLMGSESQKKGQKRRM